jgi:hypothetical protein
MNTALTAAVAEEDANRVFWRKRLLSRHSEILATLEAWERYFPRHDIETLHLGCRKSRDDFWERWNALCDRAVSCHLTFVIGNSTVQFHNCPVAQCTLNHATRAVCVNDIDAAHVDLGSIHLVCCTDWL